jgi:hypothetical protein
MRTGGGPKYHRFRRTYKLAGQSIALVTIMVAPLAMYCAAQAEATGWLTASLGAMAASMALAMWIS